LVLGEQKTLLGQAMDGTYQVHCMEHSLVELLRDPRIDLYRFHAEVRHQADDELGMSGVGVYFGRHSHVCPNGPVQLFVQADFNDIHSQADRAMNFNRAHPQLHAPVPKGNRLNLNVWECGPERGTIPTTDSTLAIAEVVQPPRGPGAQWRSLVVEIEPAEIRVFWDGAKQPTLTVPTARIEEYLQAASAQQKQPGLPSMPDAALAFAPRGGLGLYVEKGTASFRNVRVEPLN
jgi:hypothetical protein